MNSQPGGPLGFDRERELEEQHLRERHMIRQQEEMAQREREQVERERQHREQYQPVPQHQNNAGQIPIHQPVASRLAGAIHSPGGLLANHNAPPSSNAVGSASTGSAFGGPLHNENARSIQQHNLNNVNQPQHQMFGQSMHSQSAQPSAQIAAQASAQVFGGPLQAEAAARSIQQMPFNGGMAAGHPAQVGTPALGQGQQPILNDALSYLDQVKVQFVDQPDVYNRFLDIMKDFKSQTIDTPGVIGRVSELFAGHPNLIQGFNTFLPPGYRIECGPSNDPNTIRVTTPMGTTMHHITGAGRSALPDAVPGPNGSGTYYAQRGGGNAWHGQTPQHTESPEAVFSPQSRNGVPPYAQAPTSSASFESQQAAVVHEQEQQGVSQLQNAVATATGQPPPRNIVTPTPTSGGQAGANGSQANEPKRGPVEFNHAISYVNKIKNRFHTKPEIYKQFLEILQTYQRESKPIQDVYAQVTSLFSEATDLLEDFKQFLPESAAQAKAAAKAASEKNSMNIAALSQTPQAAQQPRPDHKLPAVGNFPPPSTGKENSKKRNRSAPGGAAAGSIEEISSTRGPNGPTANSNKRTKITHNTRPTTVDTPEIIPTLMPNLPEPMLPAATTPTETRDVAFFDRVKKFVANKQTMSEFLKLINLFTQDLIDKNVLIHKASHFIGMSQELMDQFKSMVRYSGPDEIIENVPKAPTGRVSLSNCRGLGPSYRLLPKRERLKMCSGRDEMCYSVLNDDWASHPTWASEDSGFVAHRKNLFEEALHRIEEERHDYDFNIEANAKVIQLLEPVAQQILQLAPADLSTFRMPLSITGQSQSIYKRILKKIYGPEKGLEVASDLFRDPISVLPIVLARLKQKDEEWRFTQREWEKIWRAQTQAMYLKSLDHMGIHVKAADKKAFSQKQIVENMKSIAESQKRQRSLQGSAPRNQYTWGFHDQDVVLDALRFAVLYAANGGQHSGVDGSEIAQFLERFVSLFFNIAEHEVHDRLIDIMRDPVAEDPEDAVPVEPSSGRARKSNGKKDLRRGVLDKSRNGGFSRAAKEDSAASGSKESTPDIGSGLDDGEELAEAAVDQALPEVTTERWLARNPSSSAIGGTRPLMPVEVELNADQSFKQDWYNMYCNQTLFVFFSLFQTLYKRLKDLKDSENDVAEEIRRYSADKAAKHIGLLDEQPEFFRTNGTSYYSQALSYIETFIEGNLEETQYQDILRHYYLKKGWALYTMPELLKLLCRAAGPCADSDGRDKTSDIELAFEKHRQMEETTYNTEITYRKQVEKTIKDGDLFLIRYAPDRHLATAEIVSKGDTTLDMSSAERKDRWKYYVSNFVRIEPTEGVPRERVHRSMLMRTLPSNIDADSVSSSSDLGLFAGRKGLKWNEDLVIQICVNTYRMTFKKGTSEYLIYADNDATAADRAATAKGKRDDRFMVKFERNTKWMQDKQQSEVEKINGDFNRWVDDGIIPGPAPTAV